MFITLYNGIKALFLANIHFLDLNITKYDFFIINVKYKMGKEENLYDFRFLCPFQKVTCSWNSKRLAGTTITAKSSK